MLSQLHGTTPEADAELEKFLAEFKGWWGNKLDMLIRFEIPAKSTFGWFLLSKDGIIKLLKR